MDLSGAWAQSATITIKGGVGKVTLHLPKAVGVHIEATAGLGRVNADGLRKEGDAYVNAAYATSAVVLTITVEAGVGEVNLTME
jgi:predicted membrane protein